MKWRYIIYLFLIVITIKSAYSQSLDKVEYYPVADLKKYSDKDRFEFINADKSRIEEIDFLGVDIWVDKSSVDSLKFTIDFDGSKMSKDGFYYADVVSKYEIIRINDEKYKIGDRKIYFNPLYLYTDYYYECTNKEECSYQRDIVAELSKVVQIDSHTLRVYSKEKLYDPVIFDWETDVLFCYDFDSKPPHKITDHKGYELKSNYNQASQWLLRSHINNSLRRNTLSYPRIIATDNNSLDIIKDGQDFSISFWINSSSVSSAYKRIAHRNEDSNDGWMVVWDAGDGTNGIWFVVWESGSATGGYSTTTGITTNTWYHVVARYNTTGNDYSIVINNVTQSTTDNTGLGAGDTGNSSLWMFVRSDLASTYCDMCTLDEMVIFDRYINQSEIDELYNDSSGISCTYIKDNLQGGGGGCTPSYSYTVYETNITCASAKNNTQKEHRTKYDTNGCENNVTEFRHVDCAYRLDPPTGLTNQSQNNDSIFFNFGDVSYKEYYTVYLNGTNTSDVTGSSFYNFTGLTANTAYNMTVTTVNTSYVVMESKPATAIYTYTHSNGACTPDWKNTSWSSFVINSSCRTDDTYQYVRNLTNYDNNNCGGANNTVYDTNETDYTCNYCSHSVTYSSYTSCVSSWKHRYYWDGVFTTCCNVTNITSDCYLNDSQADNYTYLENTSCSLGGGRSVARVDITEQIEKAEGLIAKFQALLDWMNDKILGSKVLEVFIGVINKIIEILRYTIELPFKIRIRDYKILRLGFEYVLGHIVGIQLWLLALLSYYLAKKTELI